MSDPQYPQQPDRLPSDYELEKWRAIQQFKGRPLSRAMSNAGEHVANGVTGLGKRAAKQLEKHPRAQSAVSRGQEFVAKGAQKVGAGARGAADALPDWSGTAVQSIRRTVGRVSRAGLSSKRVVALHQKRGHDVASLSDLRRLDLQQIDAVRGRGASWYYPAAAALSGASAGLVISGGELVIAASAGAAAAPSGGAIAGAFAADTAAVLGLASRAVGQVSLFHGYDPEEPAEKLFVMSVVNIGTASSATAKNAAMADISRLTQALFRGKTWEVLNDSVVTKVSQQFAKTFGTRLTKKGLGKAVPAFGIVVGSTLNWATLEGIVDAAEMAYRRRFLLEKYPHLADDEAAGSFPDSSPDGSDVPDADDEEISLLDEIAAAGGPDLR
ncbi:EcsC family protein [Streptomyces blattellae]|uniref:EcsC family protein n=1 Tax=Streptomyces blattellae TaxID=2569855 RepID=UPI0012B83A64|nr:EcsC family protein [Streptomyces blattellae]